MNRLLLLAGARHLLAHRAPTLLAVIGIALGVAVTTAVELANQGALRAFAATSQGLFGKTTHQIIGPPAGIPESLYVTLRLTPGMPDMMPVVSGRVTGPNGRSLAVLGIDPLQDKGRGGAPRAGLLLTPATVMMSAATARDLGVGEGERLAVTVAGAERHLTVLGLLEPENPALEQAMAHTLVGDITTAQELLGRMHALTRIDLALAPGDDPGTITRLLPPGIVLQDVAGESSARAEMTRAFRLNLTALSLLTLMVGLFIVYSAMTFAVVRRRQFLGLLRAQGVTRGELVALVLGEGVMLALPGVGLGLLLGVALGHGLLHLVARTIQDLYFQLEVTRLELAGVDLLQSAGLGMAGVVAATLPAALDAGRVTVRLALSASEHVQSHPLVTRGAGAGVVLLALGAAALLLPGIVAGFAALFLFIAGSALLTPGAVALLMALPRSRGPWWGRWVIGGVTRDLSRTGVAVAALTVAVAAVVAISLMIHSFRESLIVWLDQTLQADIYISLPQAGEKWERPFLDPELIARLTRVPGVASVGLGRKFQGVSPAGPVAVQVLEMPPHRFAGFRFVAGGEQRWPEFQDQGGVVISEPLSRRLENPTVLSLITPRGEHPFPVLGVYRDYGSSAGVVTMSRATFVRFWGEYGMQTMGIEITPGESVATVSDRLRQVGGEALQVRPNAAIRQASLEMFDRTFVITHVLRLLAMAVAGVGIMTALAALHWERQREFAVLRAVGLTPGELTGLMVGQSLLLGVVAGVLAMPLGLAQGWLLTVVINQRSFGWTLDWHPELGLLMQALAVAAPTALLAGLIPAWRLARTPPALGLRGE